MKEDFCQVVAKKRKHQCMFFFCTEWKAVLNFEFELVRGQKKIKIEGHTTVCIVEHVDKQ